MAPRGPCCGLVARSPPPPREAPLGRGAAAGAPLQPRFASRSISGHLRPWHAGFAQKLPPSVPHLIGPWHIAHELSTCERWSCIQLGALWLSGGVSPGVTVDATLRAPFSFSTCGSAWHSVHCRRIASPLSVMCLPSWQRKHPGKSLCPTLLGKFFHVSGFPSRSLLNDVSIRICCIVSVNFFSASFVARGPSFGAAAAMICANFAARSFS